MPSFTCLGACSGVRRVLLKLLNQDRPWSTPAYSNFRGGVDRTVTWPVPNQHGGALLSLY